MKIVPEETTIHAFDETKDETNEPFLLGRERKTILKGIIPLNLFIILTISILILSGSLLLWGASYALTKQAITELSDSLIKVSGEKIVGYLDGMLNPVSMKTRSMAREYMLSHIDFSPDHQRGYLYPKVFDFGNQGVGYFFEKPFNARFTYTFPVGAAFMNYIYQPFGSLLSMTDRINITTGQVFRYNNTVSSNQFVNRNQPFYRFNVDQSKVLGVDGVFGDPYITGGVMTIYYSHLLFDPVLFQKNGTRELVGAAKINLSLVAVANYLSTIKLLGRGYVILAHDSGTCLGASILVNQTISIFDLKDRNAGELMRQFYDMNGNSTDFENSTSSYVVGKTDNIGYIITPIKYRLENIEWNIFFVLYEEEVTATLRLTTYISIGVTAGVVIVGLLASLFIGLVVSRPMKFLEKQFKRIKVFDLEHVVSNKSIFREVNSIFKNLDETIDWLKEIKSFVPAYVLEQIQSSEQIQMATEVKKEETLEQNRKGSAYSFSNSKSESGGASFHTTAPSSYKKGGKSLFKMGLLENPTAVITIRTQAESSNILEEAFKALTVALGPVVKISQGNLQIISYNHFQLSFTASQLDSKLSEKAFETALKILKACQSIKFPIKVRIGVCVDKCSSGNLGTNNSRYYLVVGKAVERSEMFCELASLLDFNIITDFSSFQSCGKFISRPVDRIEYKPNSDKIIIWEVIDKKNEENDEWLYELEHSKENNKFKEYIQAFQMLDEKYWETKQETDDIVGELSRAIQILENCLENQDERIAPICQKLLKHFQNVLQQKSLNCNQMKEQVLTYSTSYISKQLLC